MFVYLRLEYDGASSICVTVCERIAETHDQIRLLLIVSKRVICGYVRVAKYGWLNIDAIIRLGQVIFLSAVPNMSCLILSYTRRQERCNARSPFAGQSFQTFLRPSRGARSGDHVGATYCISIGARVVVAYHFFACRGCR